MLLSVTTTILGVSSVIEENENYDFIEPTRIQFQYGTEIRNEENELVAYIYGNNLNYFPINYNRSKRCCERLSVEETRVKVENYSLTVEPGHFNLLEVYPSKIMFRQYPSFWLDKNVKVGTEIKNSQDRLIGYVLGHHMNHYPIAPRKSTMYCGRYRFEDLAKSRDLIYRDRIYSEENFKRNFVNETMCFIYMMNV